MIIHKLTKSVETQSNRPNEDFYDGTLNVYVVDDNSPLGQKILSLVPYFDFVLNNDELVDVVATTPPPPEPQPPSIEERLKATEDALMQLMMGGI